MLKTLLIYNPLAGNGQFRNHLDTLIDRFQEAGQPLVPYRLNHLEALEPMLRELPVKEYGKVLIAGGDGTLHHAVNGLLNAGIDLPVGIYPMGTANDFSQFFDLAGSVEEVTEILLGTHTIACDVGVANGSYFINVASLGHLIDISQRVDLQLKNIFGVLAYYIKGLEEIPQMKPVRIRLEADEMAFEDDIYFVLIMNGRSAGGFKRIAPDASVCDGLFDICVFRKCPVLEIMPLILQVVAGDHVNSPYVTYFKTKELTIHCDEPVGTDLDGEKGVALPMEVKIMPGVLRVLASNAKTCPMEPVREPLRPGPIYLKMYK